MTKATLMNHWFRAIKAWADLRGPITDHCTAWPPTMYGPRIRHTLDNCQAEPDPED